MADTSWDMLDDAKPPTGAPPAADATGAPPANDAIESFLASHGLAKHAAALIEATDAESCDDLKLLDVAMTEKLITQLGLKLVAAQKLRQAVAALRGEPSSPTPAADAKPADVKAADTATKPSEVPLRECTIICIDRSGSMGTPFAELNVTVHGSSTAAEAAKAVQLRTRMEAVKAMFYAFRDRVDGLGGGTQLGLIQFDNQVETLLGLTPRLERFESIVDDVEKRGQTAIFSAIVSAAAALEPVAASSPEVDLRILVLSDGQNNSGHSARDALHAAHSVGATVDAIIVGSSPDSALRKIVTATGGECYQIQNLGEGFELLENEGVASLLARRGGAPKPPRSAAPPTLDLDQLEEKKMVTHVVTSAAPARPPPPPAAARKVQSLASWSGAAGGATAAGRLRPQAGVQGAQAGLRGRPAGLVPLGRGCAHLPVGGGRARVARAARGAAGLALRGRRLLAPRHHPRRVPAQAAEHRLRDAGLPLQRLGSGRHLPRHSQGAVVSQPHRAALPRGHPDHARETRHRQRAAPVDRRAHARTRQLGRGRHALPR